MNDWSVAQEATKAAFSALGSAVILGFGWFVGQRLTSMWAVRQKRREADLSAASELYRLYGEFFAVWKLWNYCKDGHLNEAPSDVRWLLMQRAALVDAGFEALLVRVTSERVLKKKASSDLGSLRQLFQQLRESIRDGVKLKWDRSDHPDYLKFKRFSCMFSNLLASDHSWEYPNPTAAAEALIEITSNKHMADGGLRCRDA